MKIVPRLREYRITAGLSQREVAEHIGITQQQYQLYESCKRDMPIAQYAQLAHFYNTSIDDLIEIIDGE